MPYSEYVFMNAICCEASFRSTHDGLLKFVRVGCYISCCIESLHSGFLSFVYNEASFCIFFREKIVDNLCKWCRSNGDKYSINIKNLIIIQFETSYSHHTSYNFCCLCVIMNNNIGFIFCFFCPDIFSSDTI